MSENVTIQTCDQHFILENGKLKPAENTPTSKKWAILKKFLGNIEGKTVLDIGCASGGYSFGLAMEGAKKVVGIDNVKGHVEKNTKVKNEFFADKAVEFKSVELNPQTIGTAIDEKFDYVILLGITHWLYAKGITWPELALFLNRITKEKCVFEFIPPWDKKSESWARELEPEKKLNYGWFACRSALSKYFEIKSGLQSAHERFMFLLEKKATK